MCSPSQRVAAWLGCFAGIDTAVLLSHAGQLGRVQSPNAIRMESTRLEHAGMTPHARTLAPCTDFADWGRGSPAPLLVALQLAISLSLKFLESRRCQADPVTPAAATAAPLEA